VIVAAQLQVKHRAAPADRPAARPDRICHQVRREPENSCRAVANPPVLASIPAGSAPEAAQ